MLAGCRACRASAHWHPTHPPILTHPAIAEQAQMRKALAEHDAAKKQADLKEQRAAWQQQRAVREKRLAAAAREAADEVAAAEAALRSAQGRPAPAAAKPAIDLEDDDVEEVAAAHVPSAVAAGAGAKRKAGDDASPSSSDGSKENEGKRRRGVARRQVVLLSDSSDEDDAAPLAARAPLAPKTAGAGAEAAPLAFKRFSAPVEIDLTGEDDPCMVGGWAWAGLGGAACLPGCMHWSLQSHPSTHADHYASPLPPPHAHPQVCGGTEGEATLLLCDACDRTCHTGCAGLRGVPSGGWRCTGCKPAQRGAGGRLRKPAAAAEDESSEEDTSDDDFRAAPKVGRGVCSTRAGWLTLLGTIHPSFHLLPRTHLTCPSALLLPLRPSPHPQPGSKMAILAAQRRLEAARRKLRTGAPGPCTALTVTSRPPDASQPTLSLCLPLSHPTSPTAELELEAFQEEGASGPPETPRSAPARRLATRTATRGGGRAGSTSFDPTV